jgi:hypothetical protein
MLPGSRIVYPVFPSLWNGVMGVDKCFRGSSRCKFKILYWNPLCNGPNKVLFASHVNYQHEASNIVIIIVQSAALYSLSQP